MPGCDEKTFMEKAELAKKNCPVSMALTGVGIVLSYEGQTLLFFIRGRGERAIFFWRALKEILETSIL